MGRTSSSYGNAYKNPVDNYRKQLGRNEERRTTLTRRKRKKRANENDYGLAKFNKEFSNTMTYFLVVMALIVFGYALFWAGAGGVLYDMIYDDPVKKIQRR